MEKIAGRVLLLSRRTTERQITVIQVPLLDPWIEKQQKRRAEQHRHHQVVQKNGRKQKPKREQAQKLHAPPDRGCTHHGSRYADDHIFHALPPGTHHGFPARRQPPQVSPQQIRHVPIKKISQKPEETGRAQRSKTIPDHVADSRPPSRGRAKKKRTDDGNDVGRSQFHKAGDNRNPYFKRNEHGRINGRNLRG